MSLKIEIFHTLAVPAMADDDIHATTLTIDRIRTARYQNGAVSLHFSHYDALEQAHENTGWLPVSTGPGEHWDGFVFVLFQRQCEFRKLIALIDAPKTKVIYRSDFCLSHQTAGQKMRLRLFTDPACSQSEQDLVIENISALRFNQGSYYLEFDDVGAFQKCQRQTDWETDIEKRCRTAISQSFTRSSGQCCISVLCEDTRKIYNNFELCPAVLPSL